MRITVNPPDYKDLAIWRIKRLADGMHDKEDAEELAEAAIGMDVKYVLRSNNIELVKRYMKSPVGIEEYRELRSKLLELQAQQPSLPVQEVIAGAKLNKRQDLNPVPDRNKQQKAENQFYQKDSIVDLVA